uniref:Coiled-coil-helix-coiled-coil-helix domain containing 1 n=1 Tax=Dromaius novaehollandiae TaxID=8790 RepID=A0A8C4J5E7_DRONO
TIRRDQEGTEGLQDEPDELRTSGNLNPTLGEKLLQTTGFSTAEYEDVRTRLPLPKKQFQYVFGRYEATCITEMSVMMACWKQNDFSNAACAEEIRTFYDCVAKAEKERREKAEDETLEPRGKLTSSKVNKLLRRFPNITRYI